MASFSIKLDPTLNIHYKDLLCEEEGEFSIPQYTFYAFKNKNWSFIFYKSGKVLIQGKDIDYPVKKFFNPDLVSEPKTQAELAPYPHIGCDESGKGDFFGPLCVAGVFLDEETALKLKTEGVMDSKKLDDKKILKLADIIKENAEVAVITISNKKYNELYKKIKNLNKLLAWAHSTVIEDLVNKTNAKNAVLDKFADEKVILSCLKEKSRQINLIQQTKAESDTAVASASIIARAEYVKKMSLISKNYEMDLPKGAGENVLLTGKSFIQKYGIEELNNVSKTHFKTFEILKS